MRPAVPAPLQPCPWKTFRLSCLLTACISRPTIRGPTSPFTWSSETVANLTFRDYISETLAYMNENRDSPERNRKIREDDVKTAINRGRHRMLRKVGVGLYRTQFTQDASAGDFTPPADFFNQALVHYTGP